MPRERSLARLILLPLLEILNLIYYTKHFLYVTNNVETSDVDLHRFDAIRIRLSILIPIRIRMENQNNFKFIYISAILDCFIFLVSVIGVKVFIKLDSTVPVIYYKIF
jgi:hypothetical protein